MVEKITDKLNITDLKMPTKIFIGDKDFLSDEKSMKDNKSIYFKNFKCKNKWVGEATLNRIERNNDDTIETSDYLSIMFAAEESLLDLYKNQNIYDYQKVENKEVYSKSKDILLQFNSNTLNLKLNNSGLFADIIEIYGLVNKFEGLIINVYLGEDNDFESLKNLINEFLIMKGV